MSGASRQRVLVLSPGYPVDGEWYGHAVAEQISALRGPREIVVQSLAPRPRVPAAARLTEVGRRAGVPVYGPPRGGRARRLLTLARWHGASPPDLVWSLWLDRSGPAAMMLARRWGVPWVASVLGGELADLPEVGYGGARRRRDRWWLQRVLRSAAVVTVGSAPLAARAEQVCPGLDAKVTPVGVRAEDVAVRDAEPWRLGAPLSLVTVTDAAPVKGAAHVFAALAAIRAQGVQARLTVFTLAPASGRVQLARLARRAGVEHAVDFPPAAAPAELQARLRDFDVFVAASAHESQGLAATEAALAEVPVVSPRVGVAEALAELGAAWLVNAHDELATCVLEAAARAPRARRRVAATFGLEACTARFEAALEGASR